MNNRLWEFPLLPGYSLERIVSLQHYGNQNSGWLEAWEEKCWFPSLKEKFWDICPVVLQNAPLGLCAAFHQEVAISWVRLALGGVASGTVSPCDAVTCMASCCSGAALHSQPAFSFCVTSRIPAVLESPCRIIGRFFCCVLFPNDVLAALICPGKTSFTSAEFAGSMEIHYPSVLCSCTKMFPVKPHLAVILWLFSAAVFKEPSQCGKWFLLSLIRKIKRTFLCWMTWTLPC